MEDSRIIELYWQKNTEAISETAEKYGKYCFTAAKNILRSTEDSEECVNDTWLHAWNAIPPQRPNELRMFLAKITRNLAIDRFHAQRAQKRGGGEIILVLDELAECIAGGTDAAAVYEGRELRECIRSFVRKLPEREGSAISSRISLTRWAPPGLSPGNPYLTAKEKRPSATRSFITSIFR